MQSPSLQPEDLKELFYSLLEHDKWKTQTTLAHQLEIEKIKSDSLHPRGKRVSRAAEGVTQEDTNSEEHQFNLDSSYNACSPRHIGLIAKTKVWVGADAAAAKVSERWYSKIQEENIAPLKDLREGRIKTLLVAFLWASGCANRMSKWPDAPDSNGLEALNHDLTNRFSKFSKTGIVAAYESLKSFWEEVEEAGGLNFNSTLISAILDEAYDYVAKASQEEKQSDAENDPLFAAFCSSFPQVTPALFKRYYVRNRGHFVKAGVAALRKAFTLSPPADLAGEVDEQSWPKQWHMYIVPYERRWPEEVKALYKSVSLEQCKDRALQTVETE